MVTYNSKMTNLPELFAKGRPVHSLDMVSVSKWR
jgi:hypothetical protein